MIDFIIGHKIALFPIVVSFWWFSILTGILYDTLDPIPREYRGRGRFINPGSGIKLLAFGMRIRDLPDIRWIPIRETPLRIFSTHTPPNISCMGLLKDFRVNSQNQNWRRGMGKIKFVGNLNGQDHKYSESKLF